MSLRCARARRLYPLPGWTVIASERDNVCSTDGGRKPDAASSSVSNVSLCREPLFVKRFQTALSILPAVRVQNISSVRKKQTMVETITLTMPGIMKLWFSRYLPMTVVPLRSKFTVAMSDG